MTDFDVAPGFGEAERERAAELYWQAFGAKLGRVLGPAPRGRAFFADILDPRFAICARAGGALLGLAGFKTPEGALTAGGLRDLARHYGWLGSLVRGSLLAAIDRRVEPGVLLMDGICVAPEARGRGVGTRLLEAVVEHARAAGLGQVRLDVVDANPRARALYERCGFVAGAESRLGPLAPVFGFVSATEMRRAV